MIEFEHISYNDPVFDEVIDQVKKTVSNYDSSLLIKYLNEEHKTRKDYSGREIYELLQNAEDQESEYVKIFLDESVIRIENGGSECVPFSRKGFISIMMADKSPKLDNGNKQFIGSKGLGFRSILNWAKSIKISSNEVTCEFSRDIADGFWDEIKKSISLNASNKDYDSESVIKAHESFANSQYGFDTPVPTLLKPKTSQYSGQPSSTIIEIEYDKNNEYVLEGIKEQLQTIDGNILLFLKNIKTVEIENRLDNVVEKYERQSIKAINDNISEYEISRTHGSEPPITNIFYVYKEEGMLDKRKYEVGIAYCKEVELSGKYLYSFFPTKKPLNSPGLVHATFELDSNRKAISEHSKNNDWLMQKLGSSMVEFSEWIAEERANRNLYDWRAMNILLIKESDDYPILEKSISDSLSQINIIPTFGDKYSSLNAAKFFGESFSSLVAKCKNLFETNNPFLAELVINNIPENLLVSGKVKPSQPDASFVNAVNALSASLVGVSNELDLRTEMIQVLCAGEFGSKFNILIDRKGNVCNTTAYLHSGRVLPDPPQGLSMVYVNDLLRCRLEELYGKDPEKIRRELSAITSIDRSDITRQKESIKKFARENSDIDEFKRLIRSFYKGIYQVDDDDKIDDVVRVLSSEILLFDKSGMQKHLPHEMVLCDSNCNYDEYKDEWKLYMTAEEWAVYIGCDINSVKEFFYNILNVSESVPKDLVSFGSDSDYLKDNSLYYNTLSPLGCDSSNISAHVDTLREANYSYVVKEEFLSFLSEKYSCGNDILRVIFGESGCRSAKSERTIRHYYKCIITEVAKRCSYFEYRLSKSTSLERLRYYIVSENLNIAYPDFYSFEVLPEISEYEMQQILINLGAREKIESLSKAELYELLYLIPDTIEPGKVAAKYKKIREAILAKKEDISADAEAFRNKGRLYARKNDSVDKYPASDVYYWDNGQLPKAVLATMPKLEIGTRIGEDSVRDVFGVNLAKDIIIEEVSGESIENAPLERQIEQHLKERIKYILSYCYDEQKDFKTTHIAPILKIRFKLYKRYIYRIDGQQYQLQDGEMITKPKQDHEYYICSSLDNISNGMIEDPRLCEAIVESICISLKITGKDTVSALRNIISSSVKRNEYLWGKDIDRGVWTSIQKEMGMSDAEGQIWDSISFQTKKQIDKGQLVLGEPTKIAYLSSIFPEINFSNIFSKSFPEFGDMPADNLYALLLGLREYGVKDISSLDSNGLYDYYQSRLLSIKDGFCEKFKSLKYSQTRQMIEVGERNPDVAYSYYKECQNFRSSTKITDTLADELKMEILDENELREKVSNRLQKEYGLNSSIVEETIQPLPQYFEILAEYEKTEADIDQQILSLMYFEGYEDVFRNIIEKVANQARTDAQSANAPINYTEKASEYHYGHGISVVKKIANDSDNSGDHGNGGNYNQRPAHLYKNGKNAEWLVYNTLVDDKKHFSEVRKNSRILDPTMCKDNSDKHCDIIYCKTEAPGKERYLEVKSLKGDSIYLSDTEHAFAIANKEQYDIAVVQNKSFTILESPFSSEDNKLVAQTDVYRIDLKIEQDKTVSK